MSKSDLQRIINNILSDIRVEMSDEFDRNFERQAFFTEKWQRRKSPMRPNGAILIDTGRLRESIQSMTTADSITFFTTEAYAAIHNEGGEIVVTKRMKGYFWHKYMNATGALAFARKKDGSLRRDKGTKQIVSEAEFWKFMALKKVGSTIRIPRRRFLGTSPEVEQTVREIVEKNLVEYFESVKFDIREK